MAALNLKELKYEGNYIKIPYELLGALRGNGRRFTSGMRLIGAMIHSYSDEQSTCNHKYNTFCASMNLSYGTVAYGLLGLQEANYIEKKGRSSYISKLQSKYFLRMPLFFLTETFSIKGEFPRELTLSEALVLALFYTRCKNDKKADKTFTTSASDIKNILNLSVRSARRAINTLLRAGLIYRAADEKGLNGYKKSTYHLNDYLLRLRRGNGSTSPTSNPAESKWENPSVRSANLRAERESYYARKRSAAIALAERNNDFARSDREYAQAEKQEYKADREIAKAELFGGDIAALKRSWQEARNKRLYRLKKIGLTMEDLEPKFECSKCSDSGYLPSGVACDCYRKE